MAFVSFAKNLFLDNSTAVSNRFITEFLPTCNGDCARVYLYGLYICGNPEHYDNTIETFANDLELTTDDVISAYTYWQSNGLVQILSLEPIEIKYLPVKQGSAKIKKYTTSKYADFNVQIQAIIEGRMITTAEFGEYYAFLDAYHVEPAALIMIAKYCTNIKGTSVGYSYILTVARNWAYAGVRTVEAVRTRLEEENSQTDAINKILSALKQKRGPVPADFELYTKFTTKLGYSLDTILHVAKKCKGSFSRLDSQMLKYFELKLFEKVEIDNYEDKKSELTTLAITVNKKIGVYYENVDSIIENYIVPWQMRGFDDDTIIAVASFCFKSGIRDLKGMDNIIAKFYKMGITSVSALDEFICEKVAIDKSIKEVFKKLNLTKEPSQVDRDFYNTWTNVWNFSPQMIDYACELSADKLSPVSYMNKVLSNWHEQNITTREQASTQPENKTKAKTNEPRAKNFIKHFYTDNDITRIFSNIDIDDAFK